MLRSIVVVASFQVEELCCCVDWSWRYTCMDGSNWCTTSALSHKLANLHLLPFVHKAARHYWFVVDGMVQAISNLLCVWAASNACMLSPGGVAALAAVGVYVVADERRGAMGYGRGAPFYTNCITHAFTFSSDS